VKTVTPTEAKEILDSDDSAVYIDVRTEPEFAAGHPVGALNIPAFVPGPGGLAQNPDFVTVVKKLIPTEQRVLCACQAGGRSRAAAQLLINEGFADVSNVLGGFGGGPDGQGGMVAGWRDAGLPVSETVGDGVSYSSLRAKAGL